MCAGSSMPLDYTLCGNTVYCTIVGSTQMLQTYSEPFGTTMNSSSDRGFYQYHRGHFFRLNYCPENGLCGHKIFRKLTYVSDKYINVS